MSLEQALAENTATMKQLITVLQSAAHPVESETKAPRAKKTEVATAAAAVASTPAQPAPAAGNTNDAAGNPIGTLYFDVPAHNTAYAVKPGELNPTVAGSQQISDTQFLTKKAQYAANFKLPQEAAAAPAAPAPAAPAPVATPSTAATAPSATPAPATASAASAEPSFVDVVNKFKELHALKGNDGMLPLLQKHGATTLTALNGKVANAVLIADAQSAIDAAKLGL